MTYDDRIDKRFDRTDHIRLTCKDHSELRWSTKNIGNIGARSIFYLSRATECLCPASFLRILTDEEIAAHKKG